MYAIRSYYAQAGQVIYQKAAAEGQAQQAPGEEAQGAARADDDVVDAEFEEVDDNKKAG